MDQGLVVPNLGVNPMNYPGNMPSGPVGASLGGSKRLWQC